MGLGRSPEYHWNQIISKSVHRFSISRLKLFLFIALAAILLNGAEQFQQDSKTSSHCIFGTADERQSPSLSFLCLSLP